MFFIRVLLCLIKLAALVVLLTSIVFAQRLPLKQFTTADGLTSSVVHFVAQDSKGFLWFCARGGLSRWDGTEFVTYRIADDIPSPLVHKFLETRDGVIWIAVDGAVYRVKPESPAASHPVAEGLPSGERKLSAEKVFDGTLVTLFEDRSGRLWGSTNRLYRIEDRDQPTVRLIEVSFNPYETQKTPQEIQIIDETADGSLWFGYASGIVRLLPDGRFVYYEIPVLARNERTYSVRHDIDGRIWFSHTSGVFVLIPEPIEDLASGPGSITFKHPITEQELGTAGTLDLPDSSGHLLRIRFKGESESKSGAYQMANPVAEDFFPDADGTIWLPSQESIYKISGRAYRRLSDPSHLIGTAKRIVKDLAGNVWIGTFAGAFRFSPNGLTSYDRPSGLEDPVIHRVQQSDTGPVIFHGTWFVSRFVDGMVETKQLELPSTSRFSWTSWPIHQAANGPIWALTTSGLYKIPPSITGKPELVTDPSLGRSDRPFYRAFTDKKGSTWFSIRGTGDNALFRHDPVANTWDEVSALEGYPRNFSVTSMSELSDGSLWFGMYQNSSVYKLADGKFTEYKLDSEFPVGSIFALQADGNGRLWIGTSGAGVIRVEDPTSSTLHITRITEADGLTSNNVRCLTIGPDNAIYAGTITGVNRIALDDGQITTITGANGLAADFVHDAFADRDGVLWFGTANGLSRYEPRKPASSAPPTVYISDLMIAGTRYSVSPFGQTSVDSIELPSDKNNIQVRFFGLGSTPKVNYSYLLEGAANPEWSVPTSQRTLNFANLSPGTYRLLVNAVGEGGIASKDPAIVAFTIQPPIWRRWWFVALLVLFAGAAVFALDRFRVAKTRQVEGALAQSRESEDRFRTLAETASDAIITIDEDSNIVFVNKAIEKVFGYTPAEVIGKSMPMLMPERMRGGHHAGISRYVSTGSRNINWSGVSLPGLHKDGHEIPLELSFGEFERGGKRYFTGIVRDVSERKRAERELQEEREERFRELERVRSRIASDLHDDIGSSLTQIAVLSEVARGQAAQGEEQNQHSPLDRIKAVSRELVAVMSDIVWAINPQKDYLHDLVLRMRRFGSDLFTSRNIAFELKAPVVDTHLQLGANIRREVFAIYKEAANNAVKYSECRTVRVKFAIEKNSLVLSFKDDGKGFDVDQVLSDGFRPDMGGNGLASMQKRASELGGSCEVRSSPNEGTSIVVKIPLPLRAFTSANETVADNKLPE